MDCSDKILIYTWADQSSALNIYLEQYQVIIKGTRGDILYDDKMFQLCAIMTCCGRPGMVLTRAEL